MHDFESKGEGATLIVEQHDGSKRATKIAQLGTVEQKHASWESGNEALRKGLDTPTHSVNARNSGLNVSADILARLQAVHARKRAGEKPSLPRFASAPPNPCLGPRLSTTERRGFPRLAEGVALIVDASKPKKRPGLSLSQMNRSASKASDAASMLSEKDAAVTADATKKVLVRGEKLDSLREKSDALALSSEAFYASSKEQNADYSRSPIGWFTGSSSAGAILNDNKQLRTGSDSAITPPLIPSNSVPEPASNVRTKSVDDHDSASDERSSDVILPCMADSGPVGLNEVDSLLKESTLIFD